MNADTQQLLRYLDREMCPAEAERFRARLADSAKLRRELQEMQQVGALLRLWSGSVEARAAVLLEPTLRRVDEAARRRTRHTALACGLAVLLLVSLRGSERGLPMAVEPESGTPRLALGAAIERVEATDQQARVFVVGRSLTPVVWLDDDAQDDRSPVERDPG